VKWLFREFFKVLFPMLFFEKSVFFAENYLFFLFQGKISGLESWEKFFLTPRPLKVVFYNRLNISSSYWNKVLLLILFMFKSSHPIDKKRKSQNWIKWPSKIICFFNFKNHYHNWITHKFVLKIFCYRKEEKNFQRKYLRQYKNKNVSYIFATVYNKML